MKNMKKQLSLFLVLALILGTLGNLTFASAATKESSWSFKTRTGQVIKVGGDIHMQKDEYQNFDIYKSGKEIKPTDKTRTITWSSSDEDVIWIDPSNGRARADKFGTMTEDYGEAVITVRIENKVTKAVTRRSFNVSVGTPKPSIDHIELVFKDGSDGSQTLKVNETYELETLIYDAELEVITAEDASLYIAYFCDNDGVIFADSTIKPIKEGEYSITVGAFATEEEAMSATSAEDAEYTAELNIIAEDNTPKITTIRQITLSTVALTFNKAEYAKALVDNSNLLNVTYDISGYPYPEYFQNVLIDEKDPATVLVSMYNNLLEGVNYTFTYKGTETVTASITGSSSKPAKIELQQAQVQVERDYYFEVKILNDKGVDITDIANVAEYSFTFEPLDAETDQEYIFGSNSLYFFEPGKRAAIRAKLDLGYDEYGNAIAPLTDVAYFVSIPQVKPVVGQCNGYAVAGASAAEESLIYNSSVKTICEGDYDNYYVYATFLYTDEFSKSQTRYIASGQDTTDGSLYTYKSSNPNVVEVDAKTGLLYPFEKGTASINILDAEGKHKGAVQINITDERALDTFSLVPSASKLSATGNIAGDEYITIKLNAKDQLGDKVDAQYSFAVTEPADSDFNLLFSNSLEGDTLKIWEGALLTDTVTTKSPVRRFKIEITATYKDKTIKQPYYLTVKNVTNVTATTAKLSISNTNIDLKLDKESLTEYESEIQVVLTDNSSDKYFIRRENARLIYSSDAADITDGQYSILILYKNAPAENITVEQVNGKLILKPITTSGGNEITKAALGTYTIRLFRGNGTKAQPLPNGTIVLTDSTPSISVSIKEKQITDTNLATIKNAITFKRGTTDISSFVEIVGLTPRTVNNTYHISELVLHVKAKEFNPDWPSEEDYTKVTLSGLNLQFKLPN